MDKEVSVFKAWSNDKPFLEQHDFPKWKVPRVMRGKTEEEIDDVKQFFKDHKAVLTDLFMNL